ncbi:ImmA/IrrE family metallo-endopeptidase [Arthrobacter alpinus]|uniref:ImmA/IrrE family metallo-endopeptidase n=1 Tax=Arthrobacter alpinus TaxID=656366 RepID=UPI001646B20F|nr:ImmA/IrrE family metallo-endopeptidase [Arthrobacter alpinus]
MSHRDARRAAVRANKALILDSEASLESIQKAVEALRGITIVISVLDIEQHDLSALTADYDDNLKVIYYATQLSLWHRQHSILHEISHLLLGHEHTAPGVNIGEFSRSFPSQPRKLLGRKSFTDDAEQTAETLADLLADRISSNGRQGPDEPGGLQEAFG